MRSFFAHILFSSTAFEDFEDVALVKPTEILLKEQEILWDDLEQELFNKALAIDRFKTQAKCFSF